MKKKRRKFKSMKKGLKYWISFLVMVLISGFMSYNNIENLNWRTVFKNIGISDYVPKETDGNNKYEMSVHFLNVGKADCAYIKCGEYNMLIDAADREPTNVVVEYLKRQGVSKLDLVVVSHPHRDHIGQMAEVIREFKVDKFIQPQVPNEIIPVSMSYEKMLKALKEKNVKVTNINNNSVVLKIKYSDISFLFTGDAEKLEENEILEKGYDLKSTVLKVGHHGSRTSSGENFLANVLPQYAVVSVAPDRNNLPKQDVINRISKYCKNIYRTDLNGTIVMLTDGKNLKVTTEK